MSKTKNTHIHFGGKDLGSIEFLEQDFDDKIYKELENAQFKKMSAFEKHEKANRTLFELIQNSEGEVYLMPKAVNFFSRLREVIPTFNIGSFEFWLIHFSGASDEEQAILRGKMVGKYVPRNAYQKIFPLGLGVKHPGPHFSFAHFSPDLDTITASFHCFMAAFACRPATSRHHWIVPTGAPQGSIEIDFLFRKALGQDVFRVLSRSEKRVQISSLDLLTHKNIEKKGLKELYYNVEHSRSKKAVILVEEDGSYIGDWRPMDVDPIRSLISRFWRMLSEHQNSFHIGIISLFAKKELRRADLEKFAEEMLNRKLGESSCCEEFSEEQKNLLDLFLKDVLQVNSGFMCSYRELATSLSESLGFDGLEKELTFLGERPFFNGGGLVIGDRGLIFKELESVITAQKDEYKSLLQYFDTLEIAQKIKRNVFKLEPKYLSHLSDIEQIRQVMGDYHHMTVVHKEGDKCVVLGVIHASDINKTVVASASWNDFSNPNETDSRPEIEVISYIDHHRSNVTTRKPGTGIVLDAQSSNSIYANLLTEINDQYSTGGISADEIERQIQEVSKDLNFPANVRILRRLLMRKDALMQNRQNDYYVSYAREVHEYLQCVFAMLDDTDLLTKVTEYDVVTMCTLVNRLKSLMLRKEVEVVNFDDLQKGGANFVQTAAKKLLRTTDLHSLYSVIYQAKEDAIDKIVLDAVRGLQTSFFHDTKVLMEYACIGQFKHFVNNEPAIHKKKPDLRKIWIEHSKLMLKENPDLRMFVFMLSTISSSEELFADKIDNPAYKDEVWLWIPPGHERSENLLKKFLSSFSHSPSLENEELEMHFYGKSEALEKICEDAIMRPFKREHHRGDARFIVMKVPQKKIVSRKGQLALCL